MKKVDKNLSIYDVGECNVYQRQWNVIIPSSAYFVTFTKPFEGKQPQSRALLCTMVGHGLGFPDLSAFVAFLNHLNRIS